MDTPDHREPLRRACLHLCVGACLSLLPTAAVWSASESDKTSTEAVDGERSLEEIVVSAQRRDESLQRTPLAVSVVTAEALQQRAVFSEADLQRTVPGLTVRATQNSNQLNFSIRGQTVDAFSSSASAVVSYLDEVPISPNTATALFDLQSVQVLKGPQGTLFGRNATGGAVLFTSAKPTNELEGYATVRLGNYAARGFEGALNVPLVDDRVLLRIAGTSQDRDGIAYNLFNHSDVGSIERRAGRISLLTKLTDDLENTLVVDYAHSGGTNVPNVAYSAYDFGSTNNGYALEGTGSLLFSPGLDAVVGSAGAWNAYLAAHPGTDPAGLVAFTQTQRERGPYTVAIDDSLKHSARTWMISNTTAWQVSEGLTFKNIVGFSRSRTFDGADFDGSPFGIESLGSPNDPPWGYELRNRSYSEEMQLVGTAGNDRLDYVAGLFFVDSEQEQLKDHVHVFDLSPFIPESHLAIPGVTRSTSYAAYAQINYDLSAWTGIDGLGFVAGARYTSSKEELSVRPGHSTYNRPGFANDLSNTFEEPSWQFGLNAQVNPDLLLYAVTRRSFRSGGYNIFGPSAPGTAAEGGAAFDPEIATDVELGLKLQSQLAGAPFRFNAAAYTQWVDDIQRTTYATIPGYGLASLTVNVPQARMRGFEIEAQVDPTSWLELGGNVAYTDAEFTRNQSEVFGRVTRYGPYPDTPEWAWSLFAQTGFDLGTRGTHASLRADVYSQTRFYFSSTNDTISPGTDVDGYKLVNLRATLENINGSGWTLAGMVRNLTDETYYVGGVAVGQIISVNSASPGEPRTYFVEATRRF